MPRIHRTPMQHERDFAILPNTWSRDTRLSLRARGILALLNSHEDGWHMGLQELTTDSEGIAAVRTAVRELEALGYLRRTGRRDGGRFTAGDWLLDDPHRDAHRDRSSHAVGL